MILPLSLSGFLENPVSLPKMNYYSRINPEGFTWHDILKVLVPLDHPFRRAAVLEPDDILMPGMLDHLPDRRCEIIPAATKKMVRIKLSALRQGYNRAININTGWGCDTLRAVPAGFSDTNIKEVLHPARAAGNNQIPELDNRRTPFTLTDTTLVRIIQSLCE